MLSSLILGAALAKTPTIVALDGLVIAFRQGESWSSPENLLKPGPCPSAIAEVGFGSVRENAAKIERIVEGEGVGGLWIEGASEVPRVLATNARVSVPRPVKQLGTSNEAYIGIVRNSLQKRRIAFSKVRLTCVLQTDLDGDGRSEVLIEATNLDGSNWPDSQTRKGDYSIVLLRTETKAGVRQFDLLTTPSKDYIGEMHRLRGVADFDGDGVMEFVTSSNYYEGQAGTLWRLRAGKLVKLAENGAGA